MNKIILIIGAFFWLLCNSCCDSEKNVEEKKIAEMLSVLNVASKYDWVVILPGMGCHGCIVEGEYFMQQHVSDERILFVLTKISSLKILQQKTKIKFSDHSNVLIDKDNHYHLTINKSIYPCILEVKEGKLQSYKFQSPETNAFSELELALK